jgi:hypothetical protein
MAEARADTVAFRSRLCLDQARIPDRALTSRQWARQAIARANRVYPGKDFGLIVDYNGMLKSLRAR